jgi:acyl transferase domain-containing protein
MACRVPGAADPEELWRLLEAGAEAPATAGDGDADGPPIKRLNGSNYFDWRTFGLSPKESVAMDPQQKLLLELTWEGIADAGLCRREIAGRQVAVVIGAMWHDHMRKVAAGASDHEGYEISASTPAFLAARISHVFDLRGPAQVLDAGCASSLLAIIDACRMLATGEVELAVAGGVNMIQGRESTDMMTKAGLLSPSGRCRPLDARADGFVRGEGGALVVLKRSADVAPGDRVYCVIRGWAASQGGRADWIMAPVPEVQQFVIGVALGRAGVTPEQIDYVELNGTGFARGDAVEVRALSAALRAEGRTRPCFVGSLKSNLGHLEATSGVASLLKVALALHRRRRPASINVEHQNDVFYAVPGVEIQRDLTPWKESDGLRFAGVSSLSYSGSNAHVVVQGLEPAEQRTRLGRTSLPLGISAGTRAALEVLVARYLKMLEGPSATTDSLADICYTACLRREHRAWRLAVCGRTSQELSAALRAASLPSSPTARVVFWVPEAPPARESFWRTVLSFLPCQEWFREPLAKASPEVIAATLCREPGVSAALLSHLLLARWQEFGIEGYPIRAESTAVGLAALEGWLLPSRFATLAGSVLAHSTDGGLREGDEVIIALADPIGLRALADSRTLICPDFSDPDACTAALAELYTAGCVVDWESSVPAGRCVSLPCHPWVASTPSNEKRTQRTEPPRRSDASRGEGRQHLKRRRILANRLLSAARRVLGHSESEPLSLTRPLFELGFTSIGLAALRVELERELHCQLSVARLLYCRTLQEVTELLLELGAEATPSDVASSQSFELGS